MLFYPYLGPYLQAKKKKKRKKKNKRFKKKNWKKIAMISDHNDPQFKKLKVQAKPFNGFSGKSGIRYSVKNHEKTPQKTLQICRSSLSQ